MTTQREERGGNDDLGLRADALQRARVRGASRRHAGCVENNTRSQISAPLSSLSR